MSDHGVRTLTEAEITVPDGHILRKMPAIAGGVGVVGLLISLGMGMSGENEAQFYFSYLTAYMYFLSLALGGLFFVLVQFIARAGWSVVVRRVAENIMATLPVFIVLFAPIVLGMGKLFHWMHPEGDPVLEAKKAYLNTGFFGIRAVIYFVSWLLMSWWFLKQSSSQDKDGLHDTTRRLQAASAPALIVFALTLTFASFDWIMSLDPHWYSTIYGAYYFSGSVVGIFALLAVLFLWFRSTGLLKDIVTIEHFHDLGKLLFAFTVFWTYIAFSQYFLQWYANMPEETIFFQHRMEGSWLQVSYLIMLGHFVVPFFFLLPRTIKRIPATLLVGALWMLFIHFVDIHWLVMPNHHHHGWHFSILDVTTFVGVGGVFFAVFAWNLNKRALIPVKDPRLPESLAFENF